MPNLTLHISREHVERFAGSPAFTRRCFDLCTGILGAAAENVHIIYNEVWPGAGHPLYAELAYRLTTARTPEVMARFMRELEAAVREQAGVTARIRCFGYPAQQLFARN